MYTDFAVRYVYRVVDGHVEQKTHRKSKSGYAHTALLTPYFKKHQQAFRRNRPKRMTPELLGLLFRRLSLLCQHKKNARHQPRINSCHQPRINYFTSRTPKRRRDCFKSNIATRTAAPLRTTPLSLSTSEN